MANGLFDELNETIERLQQEVDEIERQLDAQQNVNQQIYTNEPIFNDEEILALGLYPDDEAYKMSLISRILGKNKI